MHVGLIGVVVTGFLGFAAGGAYAYVESVGGEGTAKAAVQYGTGNASDLTAEALATPVQVVQKAKPSLQAAANEMTGVLGGAANGTTATTAAGEYGSAEEAQVDP